MAIEVSEIILTHPEDFKNGDYSTNVSLSIAGNIGRNPVELAEKIVEEMKRLNADPSLEKFQVAGPGFINIYLSRDFFRKSVENILNQGYEVGRNASLSGKKLMVEYTDPNPFKPVHIGHLMTNAIGESIARIAEHSGAEVARANYQGDVGLHVAKAIYGLIKDPSLEDRSGDHKAQALNIGKAYVLGSQAYEDNEFAKKEIDEINKKIYARSDEEINRIYEWGFEATMKAFEDLYAVLGTKFTYYFLESQMAGIGAELVRANMGNIFEDSDGAVVFKAEKYDPKLHTRVFITSQGLPTYEAKELGLAQEKFKTEPAMDISITVTANEQEDYMRVVAKALSLIHPEYENKMKHITHGMMRFASGKMGSRKGNVITGESLLSDIRSGVRERMADRAYAEEEKEKIVDMVAVGAFKYSVLKQSIGGDIIFDFEKSISFEGDSGPYLAYSHARANSVLEKSQKENILPDFQNAPAEIFELEKLLYRFGEAVARASALYEPHHITTYLIDLARSFNNFYGNNVIVAKDDPHSPYKVALTYSFMFVMRTGLHLLGIEAPKKM